MKRHPLADCDNCEWSDPNRHTYVPAITRGDGSLLIIGEAPGAREIDAGEPFVGPTGQLLKAVAKQTGVDLNNATLDNAVACHPNFFPGTKPEKPSTNVIKCCKPRLIGTIDDNVEKILLLGKTANGAIFGGGGKISEARKGPAKLIPHPKNGSKSIRVVSTYHPAACLRSADYFPSLVRDMRKLNAEPIEWREPNIYVYAPPWVIPEDIDPKLLKLYRKEFEPNLEPGDVYGEDWYSIQECASELRILVDHPTIIAVDIETASDKEKSFTHPDAWLSIAIATSPDSVMVIGEAYLNDYIIRALLTQVLTKCETIYHNAKFDVQVLMRLGILDEPRFTHDTMLASYVLDERPGYHGLKDLSGEFLGVEDYSAATKPYTRGKFGNFARIPKTILYKYNAYDSICTFRIWNYIGPKVLGNRTYPRLLEQEKELIYVELDGIAIDHTYIDKVDLEQVEQLEDLRAKLSRWVANPNSTKQLKYTIERNRIPIMDTRAATLTKAMSLEGISSDSRTFIGLLMAYRKLNKLHSTYILGARKRSIDGRIYPTYLQHGTVFGRLSSRNPNIQNIPRGSVIRSIYVPSPGNILVQCDYSQVELRVIACEAQDKYLQGVFRDPTRDIHGEVSDRLYGPGNWTKEDRVRAKVYVFGSIYGLEPYSIAQSYGISEAQAAREQQEFFSLIPDVMEWRRGIIHRAQKTGRLETHFGRVRRFPLVTKQNLKSVGKEGLAFVPQSTANDICLESMVRIRRHFHAQKDLIGIRNIVHDSIMVECPIDMRFDVAHIMQEIMTNTATEVYSDFAPFEAKAEFGYSWGALEDVDKVEIPL